ncbi:hypothetical protein YH66_02945 [[Brevibacterium] flavum]|uniref:Uncharacterized protein n=1 Tax=[Brevibacterium] flavum TaxID=92706 RepID=A0A0F6SQP7_9CORY|nr:MULTISPECIES: hypothetical protein [Corynebacterium]AKF26579.1 hypothetical protein YH66_02945 [[Brevibacterium] flavum]AST19816.1 hypothetical protein CEY17_02975 [Corynebacterium glutamicum ATCC 14067]KEI22275.1 hypothetical protein KIQ_006750 [Corynebacterium glutamicum ATCC 14067]KIH74548.1 hypothetical protein SD36_03015 [Corynebacterium glutamicum]OKX94677.1 hypothetical protein AUP71_07005 [Corynebacterium glutamicum]
MTITFSRVALTTLAVTATTLSLSTAANAQSPVANDIADARECVDANNVWVYVEYGEDSEKEPEGACATEFTDGAVALESAGFLPTFNETEFGKYLTSINDVAPEWDERELYWVYSSGEVADDYSVDYTYYQVGASDSRPEGGTVEAWVVGTSSDKPALTTLAETPAATGSSEDGGWIAVIAGLLALIGGGVAALYQGLITIPGLVLPKF